jgi:hypothetical protein
VSRDGAGLVVIAAASCLRPPVSTPTAGEPAGSRFSRSAR